MPRKLKYTLCSIGVFIGVVLFGFGLNNFIALSSKGVQEPISLDGLGLMVLGIIIGLASGVTYYFFRLMPDPLPKKPSIDLPVELPEEKPHDFGHKDFRL